MCIRDSSCDAEGSELLAGGQVLFDPRVFLDFAVKDGGQVARIFVQIVFLGYHAYTDDIVRQWYVPEPTFFRDVANGGRAFVDSGVAQRAFVISPDGNLI